MPGIFGTVDSIKKILSLDLSNDMLNILRHDKSYNDYLFVSDHCVMGGISLPYFNAPIREIQNKDKTLCLIMEGEIFNYGELKKELKLQGVESETKNEAELMFLLYETYGARLVNKVNGCFIVAIWDARKNEITFINDRLGTYYLYYSICNNRLVFAPEMKALLCDHGINRRLDPRSVADFFTFGFILGNKTFIEKITLMPPGSIMRYQEGKISIETYWDFPFQEDYPSRSTRDYIEEFDDVLDRTVERQTRKGNRFGMGLSGGLDSRIVAGYVRRNVDPFFTFTFGDEDAHDVIYAQRVSAVLSSQHQMTKYTLEDFYSTFNKMVWLMEGLINTSEYYYLSKAMQQRQVDTVFTGTAGETLSGKYLSKAICMAKDRNTLKNLIFSFLKLRLPSIDQESLFSNEYYKHVKGLAKRNFDETFFDIQTELSANIFLHHCMRNKVWKDWLPVNALSSLYIRCRYPYFDYDVLDFFLKLPPNMRLNQKVYKGLLINKFPELAAIPRDARTYAIGWEPYLNRYYGVRNRIGHFLLEKWYPLFKRFDPRGSFRNSCIEAYRGPRKDMICSIIFESNRKRGYFKQKYLEKVLYNHFNGEKNNNFIIHKLISFEIFHRLFIDESGLVPPD